MRAVVEGYGTVSLIHGERRESGRDWDMVKLELVDCLIVNGWCKLEVKVEEYGYVGDIMA